MEQALRETTSPERSDHRADRKLCAEEGKGPARTSSIAAVWQATFIACGAQAAPMVAVAGLAGAFAFAGSVSFDQCSIIVSNLCPQAATRALLIILQGIAVTLVQALIASVVRRSSRPRAHARDHVHAVLDHWPALLAGSLIYTALMTAAQTMAPASAWDWQAELNKPLVLPGADPVMVEFHSVTRAVVTSTLHLLLPDPGLPLATLLDTPDNADRRARDAATCALLAWERRTLPTGETIRPTAPRPQINLDRLNEYIASHCEQSSPFDGARLVLAAVLWVGADILLRFRVVAAFSPQRTGVWAGLLSPLMCSIRVAWRHFGAMAAHIWVLRLALVAARILFCTFPLLVAQRFVLPRLALNLPGDTWFAPICFAIALAATAMMNGILVAFSAVYDAQLFVALSQR
jgi:hypothetical protein